MSGQPRPPNQKAEPWETSRSNSPDPSYQPYTVKAGDTLSAIAADRYGDATLWPTIHTANQHIVPNPNLIFVGQELRIPIGS